MMRGGNKIFEMNIEVTILEVKNILSKIFLPATYFHHNIPEGSFMD